MYYAEHKADGVEVHLHVEETVVKFLYCKRNTTPQISASKNLTDEISV